jgi:hypothetical protein
MVQVRVCAPSFLNLGCNEPAVLVRMVQVRVCAPSFLGLHNRTAIASTSQCAGTSERHRGWDGERHSTEG